MKETELAEKIIDFFEDYEVFKEVEWRGIIDIVARKLNIITSIECKVNLNFDVIQQAVKNKACSHYSYVAVPYGKDREFQYKVCKEFGVGVLVLLPNSRRGDIGIIEKVKPVLNRKIYKLGLKDYMKRSIAGSQNDRMTAFKFTLEEIEKSLLRRGGKMAISDVFLNNSYHYSSITSAKRCIVDLCRSGAIRQFREEEGFLVINKPTL